MIYLEKSDITRKKFPFSLTIDDIFILFGILMNGISIVIGFILGFTIASLFLLLCEIILVGMYILKMV
ncbi:MAG: hypothetical protein K9W46_09575 [Candidatus Heimdallarchaeum endolithica]|uniref:Uncharacterized protein n=1 Tax=Candidatus Heimdallarchaeum endolithica TaxID=2876572 RepID=A0A9Y1BPF8_9ARCH|nr:MAG: hypothetical protein K9W46_09575 [Candidatus Heimdallarchaeum endolithica]